MNVSAKIVCTQVTESTVSVAYKRQAEWRKRNPLKRWAHAATASALRRGIIEREPCRICNDPRTDAHHPDHRDPLRVEWLCRKHHKAEHRRLRAALAARDVQNGDGGRDQ